MGKIFPQRFTLKEKPTLVAETLGLIEKSFHYKKPFAFQEDFAPLIDGSNHHNCYIFTDENEKVIAHIGVKEKVLHINNHSHPICLLGGIAVDEERRGEGIFRTLMEDVLSDKRSDCAFFLLWSDQEKLYSKFGFQLCGSQYQYEKIPGGGNFIKTKYAELSAPHKKEVQDLFEKSFSTLYLTPSRTAEDWALVEATRSAELHIRKTTDKITDYFFMNKGQDLTGIIYEYGFTGEFEKFVNDILPYGTVWTGVPVRESNTQQYQFMLSPADRRLFASFVQDYTRSIFTLREINLIKNEVFFDFGEETLGLDTPEFLRGLLGPGTFEELGAEVKPLFISGLDSI